MSLFGFFVTDGFISCENIDELVQERRNPIALAMELHLSCTNPSIWGDIGYTSCQWSTPRLELFSSGELQKLIGYIHLSVGTVKRTYEFSGVTHVTPFCRYRKHSTGPITYGSWVCTYSKFGSSESVLVIKSDRAQSNAICTYGRESHDSLARIHRYSLLYLKTGKYGQSQALRQITGLCKPFVCGPLPG